MRRPLHVEHRLEGDPATLAAAFLADPTRWLPEPARWQGKERWNVRLRAGRLSRMVLCRVGGVWNVEEERWRLVRWEPTGQRDDALPVDRVLPSFSGELGVVSGDDGAVLMLRGTYTPPAGAVGVAADAAGLHRIASVTGEAFTAAVAARLRGVADQTG